MSRRRNAGQALVEFAFVFPLIALLAFAFIDLGRAVFAYNTLTNAARQGARVVTVSQLDPVAGPWKCESDRPVIDLGNPTWTFRGCAVLAGATAGLQPADVTVSYAAPPGTTLECTSALNVGCIATVTVVATFTPITPVAGQLIGAMSMSSTSEMPIERLFP